METRFTARRRMAIVLALCLSAFLISVDVTIVNVALPTLVRSLGATTTQPQWVVDAYSLVFAALVLAVSTMAAGVILLTSAPATEAIVGAVPRAKAGAGSCPPGRAGNPRHSHHHLRAILRSRRARPSLPRDQHLPPPASRARCLSCTTNPATPEDHRVCRVADPTTLMRRNR